MDPTIQSALIAGISAITGGLIAGFFTLRSTQRTLQAQFLNERAKIEESQKAEKRAWLRERLELAHITCTNLEAQYSKTGLFIKWSRSDNPTVIDQKYLQTVDELAHIWVLADSNFIQLRKAIEELREGLNMFWGNFREMMRREQNGEKIGYDNSYLQKVSSASLEVSKYTNTLRDLIAEELREIETV